MSKGKSINQAMLKQFSDNVKRNPQHRASMNAVIQNGLKSTAINYRTAIELPYVFSTDVANEKVTFQKQSGRCWMFAGLNVLRAQVSSKCNMGHFEISQNHLMFWDKMEKANYFLENMIDTINEPLDGRLVSWLLGAPLQDGGQWEMYTSLVEKYGLVPKDIMPETFHSSQSVVMNQVMTAKLRENAARLRHMSDEGASVAQLQEEKVSMLEEFYLMQCHFLGEPPVQFDFEYVDKDGQYHRDPGLTPQAFAQKYTAGDLDDYVSIINAPTKDKPFGKSYTVQYLGNVQGGRPVRYLNVDIETFKDLTLRQLLDRESVWFGCDVGKMSDRDSGLMDVDLFDYEAALHGKLHLTKEQRLDYRESCLTHAMVFVGVNVVDGKPNRWKVENSWGCDPGKDGIFVMSDAWFDEYMYQVVVHKRYLSPALLQALEEEPIQLKPWDPMGSLALMQ